MIDMNPAGMIRTDAVKAIHAAVDGAMRQDDKRRRYVGASSIGSPCERKIQYEFTGDDYDKGWRFSARTLRTTAASAAIWFRKIAIFVAA